MGSKEVQQEGDWHGNNEQQSNGRTILGGVRTGAGSGELIRCSYWLLAEGNCGGKSASRLV
jgi:hypothetical protein